MADFRIIAGVAVESKLASPACSKLAYANRLAGYWHNRPEPPADRTFTAMSRIEDKLESIGESLPRPKKAVANYLGCKRSGDILYASGRVSVTHGALGTDLSLVEGQLAAKETMLDILAIVREEIGDLDKIIGVEKMLGFVRSGPEFTQQPQVIDGASDLLVSLFGENGRHARTATGVAQLPFGAAVQLELILKLDSD